MALVIKRIPQAHLLLVGDSKDQHHPDLIRREIAAQRLAGHVSLLGEQRDVHAILRTCSVGVLSSASEGFPLALLEYGMAGLPAVATRVGQCSEVLDENRAGILVPPRSPDQLAEALSALLRSPERRADLGNQLKRRVQQFYGHERAMDRICRIYDVVLRSTRGGS
jgi:glycosyltransferase involved in cell wall biosynthesis